ncbi:hypothetical protein BASA81_015304 [Batrachochytrium salamandrivorans]|nr:hypothetical protein BASA81_015304 [Batrachochytrium salamandrivorans]
MFGSVGLSTHSTASPPRNTFELVIFGGTDGHSQRPAATSKPRTHNSRSMQGTPRPSHTILGEVQDNGFFLQNDADVDFSEDSSPPVFASSLSSSSAGAGRPRGTTLEPDDDVSDPPPISLTGQQPVLAKQLNIVTDLLQHCAQTQWYLQNNLNEHLLPPHHASKPCANRNEVDVLAAMERAQLEAELKLEQEEASLLERWRQGQCLGRGSSSEAKRRSSATNPTPSNLLPPYEERVRILCLSSSSSSNNQTTVKPDFTLQEFALDCPGGGRRVQCQIYEFANCAVVEDHVFDSLAKTSDAIVVDQPFTDHVYNALWRLKKTNSGVLVVSKQFGKTVQDAKKTAQKLGALYVKTSEFNIELAAKSALVRMLRQRGDQAKPLLHVVEKQTKKLARKSSGAVAASSCATM